jgi:CheY-like chemotaxis protein
VLIAEDHEDSREALKALLEAFGFEVVEAVNGKEAVEKATTEAPMIILMDIMMPEMDGFEAIRRVREVLASHDVHIIAVTAMDGARTLALEAGANDFVKKPVDIRKLIGKMTAWARNDAH